MRSVGCRRCRLRSRRPPEETPPSYGRRAAPFLVCAGLLHVSRRRLSAIAAWVPAYCVPLSPLAPFVARPPSAPLSAPLPGGCVCPRRWGRGARSLRGRSVGVSLPPSIAGCRSWVGYAAPPPSRPKSLVAPPASMGRCGTVRLLLVGRWRLRAPAQGSSSHSAEEKSAISLT